MKRYFLVSLLMVIGTISYSQDIIILRKGETEIKCRIVALNDTAIIYRKWNTPGAAKFSFKRNEVLSYTLEKSAIRLKSLSQPEGGLISASESAHPASVKQSENPDDGMLGKYLSGEVTDGYVILNSNDTLSGLIFIKNVAMNQVAVTLENDLGVKKDYFIDDLKGYSYNNLEYQKASVNFSKEVTNGKRSSNGALLLHRTENGKAKLYRMFKLTFPKSVMLSYENPPAYLGKLKRYYVIENNKGDKVISKGKGLRKSLSKLFKEDKVMMEQIYQKVPKTEDLQKIIHEYNERQIETGK